MVLFCQSLIFLGEGNLGLLFHRQKKGTIEHNHEPARNHLWVAGKEESSVGPAARILQSSWHLLGQNGNKQASRRPGYKWNYLYAYWCCDKSFIFWNCGFHKYFLPDFKFLQARVPVPGREERMEIMVEIIDKRSIVHHQVSAEDNFLRGDKKERSLRQKELLQE